MAMMLFKLMLTVGFAMFWAALAYEFAQRVEWEHADDIAGVVGILGLLTLLLGTAAVLAAVWS